MENTVYNMGSFLLWSHCRDGRIKVIGGDGVEGLLISPKQLPYKNLEVCWRSTQVDSKFASKTDFNTNDPGSMI